MGAGGATGDGGTICDDGGKESLVEDMGDS
jgi:hypothetical protein